MQFPHGESFDTRIVIYVPSTEYDKKVSRGKFQKRLSDTTRFLSKEFGGTTVISGLGHWFDDKGKLIKENVVKVESFSPYSTYKKEDKKVEKFLKEKAKAWKQKVLSFEYESPIKEHSSLYFVKAGQQLSGVI